MNKIYDLIIVGESSDGKELNKLITKRTGLSCLLIDKMITSVPSAVEATVRHVSFNHGLIILETENNIKNYEKYFCKHLVIASDTVPSVLPILGSNIFYNIDTLEKLSKASNVIICGAKNKLAKAAIACANRFKHVFICTVDFDLPKTKLIARKLEKYTNIVHLPNCKVLECYEASFDHEVVLSTFEKISDACIFAVTDKVPDTSWLQSSFIPLSEHGMVQVSDTGVVNGLPNIFACGVCSETKNGKICSAKTVFNSILQLCY